MILFGVYHLIYEIQIEKLQISFQAYIFSFNPNHF